MMSSPSENNSGCYDVNEVWAAYGELTTRLEVKLLFGMLYSVTIFFGVLGNFVVVFTIVRHHRLRATVQNLFIASLASSDLVKSLFSSTLTPIAAFTKIWYFGALLCQIVPLIQGMSVCISTMTLATISIDRYILLVWPAKKPIGRRAALVTCCVTWLVSGALIAPVPIYAQFVDGRVWSPPLCGHFCLEIWTDQWARKVYGVVLALLIYAVPVGIITFCYFSIYWRLSKRTRTCSSSSVRLSSRDRLSELTTCAEMTVEARKRANAARSQRINRILTCMVFAFSASMLPTIVYNFMEDWEQLPEMLTRQLYFVGVVCHWLSTTSTVLNPLLYAWLNLRLRRSLVSWLPVQLRARLLRKFSSGGSALFGVPHHGLPPAPPPVTPSILRKANGGRHSNANSKSAQSVRFGSADGGQLQLQAMFSSNLSLSSVPKISNQRNLRALKALTPTGQHHHHHHCRKARRRCDDAVWQPARHKSSVILGRETALRGGGGGTRFDKSAPVVEFEQSV